MNNVVYGSQYGTAKRYAEELAYRVGYELESYEDVTVINTYETIVYIRAFLSYKDILFDSVKSSC